MGAIARRTRRKNTRREPRQARAKATIEVILETTAHILARDGWDGLTTNHVAQRAGVSVGSIYQYFQSKEGLVAALVDRHLERVTALVATELAVAIDLPFEAGTRRIIDALVRAQCVDADLHRALVEQVPKVDRLGRIREVDRRMEALLHAAFETRPAEIHVADKRLFAFLIVQTVKAATLEALVDRPEILRDGRLTEALVQMFVAYASRDVRSRAR